MTNLSEKKCLVMDYGSYLSVAQRLAAEDGFGTVYYHTPYVYNGFPDHRPLGFGLNVPNVVKVKEWAEVIDDVDIVMFCDAHEPALQIYFESIGKRVFGSKYASDLEHDREKAKQIMKDIELPLNEYSVATGIDELEILLREKSNVYVKSSLRGDMESWHHENYLLSRMEIQRMRNNMGVYASKEKYIVENPIESLAEVGVDTFCSSGRYPEETLSGIELKDTGFYGCIIPYSTLPRQMRVVTDRFAPVFRDLQYNGWHSNEIIISNNKKGYLIDMTCRMPQPPTDLAISMITNFPQCVWDVAGGNVPTLEYDYRHGVQLIIKSECAKTEPSPLIVPDEYKKYVRVKNLTIDENGVWYYTPYGIEMSEIGSVIGFGSSMKNAVAMAKQIAESIKGFDIKINTDCIDGAKEQIDRLTNAGVTLF